MYIHVQPHTYSIYTHTYVYTYTYIYVQTYRYVHTYMYTSSLLINITSDPSKMKLAILLSSK